MELNGRGYNREFTALRKSRCRPSVKMSDVDMEIDLKLVKVVAVLDTIELTMMEDKIDMLMQFTIRDPLNRVTDSRPASGQKLGLFYNGLETVSFQIPFRVDPQMNNTLEMWFTIKWLTDTTFLL